MAAAERRVQRRHRVRPGTHVEYSDGAETVFGDEDVEDVRQDPVLFVSDVQHRHRVQNKTLSGLTMLLVEVLILGLGAMAGVAAQRFEPSFAIEVLAITLTPSLTAWLVVVRWAFRRSGRDDG